MRRLLTFVFAAALVAGAASSAPAQAGDLDSKPALRAMLEEIRTELDLTAQQVTTTEGLIEEQTERAKKVVDELDDLSFDAVVDLLVEARAIREDFIPKLRGLLDDEQKQKLKSLPRSDEIYIQATVGWITEERVDKLRERLNLSDGQLPKVREIVTEQIRDSVEIVEGVQGADGGKRQHILDTVVDLRGAQRRANREIDRVLDDDQKVKFEQLKEKKKRH